MIKFSLPLPRVCLCFRTNLSSNHSATKNSVAGTRIKLKSKSMGLYPYSSSVRLLTQRGTLLAGFRHYPPASCVSYLLPVSTEGFSHVPRHQPHIWRILCYAWLLQ